MTKNFPWSPQGATRFRVGVLPVLDNLDAVHENMLNANRVLVRFFKCRPIGNRRWIEDHYIGEHPFLQESAMIEAKVCRWQCA